MSKANKRPIVGVAIPARKKVPRAPMFDGNADKCSPAWRVGSIDLDGPFGWDGNFAEKIKEVLAKLRSLEAMTWGEILAPRSNHTMPVSVLSKDARDRLVAIQLDDVDELFQIRLSGKERVWGIRQRNVLDLLWWDPEHKVYPVEKKNT